MNVNQVYTTLETLHQGQAPSIDGSAAQFMQERGLVAILDSSEYAAMQSDASRLNSVTADIARHDTQVVDYQARKEKLTKKLGSRWHRFWAFPDTIEQEESDLRDVSSKLSTAEQERASSQHEQERLEGVQRDLEGYVRTSQGYVKITDAGAKRVRHISARLKRLDGVLYDDFSTEVDQVYAAIEQRYGRFKEMYEFLVEQGFRRDSKVIQYALALSGLEGTSEEISERAGVVNDHLYNNGWKSYDRLRIASAVAGQEGDIKELRDELVEVFMALHTAGAVKSYALWSNAANIMKLPEDSRERRIARYHEFGQAAFGENWNPNSDVPTRVRASSRSLARSKAARYRWNAVSRTTAVNLALSDASPSDAAHQWSTIERALIESGRRDSTESGIAALVLTGAPGSPQDKAQRFNEAFEMMHAYGWKKDTSNYTAAAVVTTLPGTVEENVQLLNDVIEMMKADGFKYELTDMALPIISGGFKTMVSSGSIPAFVASSPEISTSSYNSGCGFDVTWAVAGDLMDNGSLDLSGGFIAGGLMGGLFD